MGCRLYWRMARRTYPWVPLALRFYQALRSPQEHRAQAMLRCWGLVVKIDFAYWMAIAIDVTQPEYWA
jgi:hypothetical protein